MIDRLTDILDPPEFLRYIVNGLVATAVHYGVLTLNLEVFAMQSAGLANVVAALFGITSSFLGSRYFVFRGHDGALFHQARSFALLYGSIAGLHGLVLLAWTGVPLTILLRKGCRDAGRLDLRSDEQGDPHFIEANPLAGLHPHHSDLPMIATAVGVSYTELIGRVVESALQRVNP